MSETLSPMLNFLSGTSLYDSVGGTMLLWISWCGSVKSTEWFLNGMPVSILLDLRADGGLFSISVPEGTRTKYNISESIFLQNTQ